MNLVWNHVGRNRFVSSKGEFSIMEREGKISLYVNYNRKNKFYYFNSLEEAFESANRIWNGGRF